MSFRRVQSIQERAAAAANGGADSIAAAAAAAAIACEAVSAADSVLPSPDSGAEGALLPQSWTKMSAPRSKPVLGGGVGGAAGGAAYWKKPFFHFILCFLMGFGIGLVPFGSSSSSGGGGAGVHLDPIKPVGSNKRVAIEQNSSLLELRSSSNHELQPRPLDGNVAEKLLLVVTPTYRRPFQAMYLTRLSQTLRLVPPPLLWIVVETPGQSLETAELLRNTGVMYRHLGCDKNMTNIKDRGTHQRNVALTHIERHQLDGIVYFADDDNFYSLELFDQLRKIKRFGTWPVAMLAHSKSKTILEGPVCEGNNVIGWHTNEKSKRMRRFHVDMSGFGFNSTILWEPKLWHRPTTDPIRQLDTVKEGFQETTFIEQLVEDESQMEGLPSGCSKIMVWHLHLEAQTRSYPSGWKMDKYLQPIIHL